MAHSRSILRFIALTIQDYCYKMAADAKQDVKRRAMMIQYLQTQ